MATIGVKIELEGAQEYRQNMSNLTAQTKLYQAELKSLNGSMGSSMSAFQKSMASSKALGQQLEAQQAKRALLAQKIEETAAKYGEESTQVLRLQTQLKNLDAEIANTEAQLKQLGGTWGAVGAQFEAIGSKLQDIGGKISSVGDTLTQKVSAPIAGIAGVAVKTAADFDSAMSGVAATMGYTVEELNTEGSEAQQTMSKLSEFAQEMGKTTAFSASESAEALNYMALAGYSAEQSMEMLPTVLNLAAAGGIELATASDMVTDAQSALGLSTEQTVAMVDQMATAAASGNTSVAQLGDAMLTIGATAAGMSGGTAELTKALTVLADNSIKGSEGGTKLRNIMLSLQDAAKDGAVDFGDFSVSVYDAEGNMRGITDIMQDISANMQGMTNEAKDAIVSGIFNKQDLAAANALLNTSSQRFDELGKSIEGASGSAQAMAEVKLDNFEGQITLLKSALEGVAIDIGQIILPYIQQFVEKIQGLVDWFSSLDSSTQELIVKAGLIVAAIGPVLSIVGRIVSAVGTIGSAIGSVISFVPTIISVVSSVGAVLTGTLIPAIAGIITALAPFLPIIAAVAAAIAAVVIVIKNWGTITEFVTEKWTALTEFLNTAVQNIISAMITWVTETLSLIQEKWNALKEFLSNKILEIQNYMLEHWGIIGQIFVTYLNYIKTVIQTATTVIKTIIQTISKLIKAIIDGNWSEIGQIIINAWEQIKKTITDGIKNVLKLITDMAKSILETFTDLISSAWHWGADFVQNFCDGITSKMQALIERVRAMADEVRSYLHFSTGPDKGPLKDFNSWPRHMMQNYAEGISAAQFLVKEAVADVAADVSVLSDPFDYSLMYDAVRSGASDANISVAIGGRDFQRAMREMGF